MEGPVVLTRTASVRTLSWNGRLQRCWDFPAIKHKADDDASAIFMVHGFRGDHHGLLRIVEELGSHRVLVPDLPGFGQSEELEGTHDAGAYAAFVAFCFTSLGLGRDTVLLGHSFGSVVASRFAAEHPSRIRSLILINPICEPALEGPGRLPSRLAELYYGAGAILPRRAGLAVLGNPLIVRGMSELMAKTTDRSLRGYIHGQHSAYFSAFASRRVVLEAFRASISGTVREVAARLRMPVLLIAAEKDDIGSIAGQRKLASMIPGSRLEIIPGVGHLVHYETPKAAAALIGDFLNDFVEGGAR